MKKLKNFIIGNLECTGWLLIYSLMLAIGIAGALAIYLTNNIEVQKKFLEIFEFIPNSDSMSNMEFSLAVVNGLSELSDFIIYSVLAISAVILIILLAIKSKIKKIKVIKKLSTKEIFRYMLYGVSMNFGLSLGMMLVPEKLMEKYSASIGSVLSGNVFMIIITTGILVPIGEEILFRNFIFDACKKVSIRYAIIASAISFGFMHGNLVQGTCTFFMGLVFAYIDNKKDNILPSIVMHISVNLSSVIITQLFKNEITGLVVFFVSVLIMNLVISRKDICRYCSSIRVHEE